MAKEAKLREQARKQELKGNWRAAIEAYRRVLEGDAADVGLWNRVGDLHLRLGETTQAVEAYETAVAAYADAGLHNNAIALCRKILRLVPGRTSIYLRLGQISAAQGFLADARQNFLEYAERMQRAGKLDASFEALLEFADLSPDDVEIRRLLAEQLASHGRPDEAVEQLRVLVGIAEGAGDAEEAEALRARIREIDPGADVSALVRETGRGGEGDGLEEGVIDLTAPAGTAAPPAAETAAEEGPGVPIVEGLEGTSLADADGAGPGVAPVEGLEPTLAGDAFAAPPDEEEDEPLPLIDLDAEPEPAAPSVEEETEEEEDEGPPLPLMELEAEEEVAGEDAATLRARVERAPEDAVARERLLERLAEEGREEEAVPVLEEAHRALAGQGMFPQAYGAVAALLRLRPDDQRLLQKRVEYAFRSGETSLLVPAYLDLGEHLLRSGEEEKGLAVFQRVRELEPANARAAEVLDRPSAAAEAPAAEPGAGEGEFIDLGSLILDDEIAEPTTRFVVEEREPTGDEDRDFADMLSHFRQKVAENIEVEDSTSHYDLGVAFKEMGLYDEAIAEFQVALRGGANPLATLELLGHCFVEKGQHAVAARVLDRATRLTGVTEADLVGVLYLLGRCEEAMGRPAQAVELLERVLAIDIRFRDAASRLESLRGSAAPEL